MAWGTVGSRVKSKAGRIFWWMGLEYKAEESEVIPRILAWGTGHFVIRSTQVQKQDSEWWISLQDGSQGSLLLDRNVQSSPWYQVDLCGEKNMVEVIASAFWGQYERCGFPPFSPIALAFSGCHVVRTLKNLWRGLPAKSQLETEASHQQPSVSSWLAPVKPSDGSSPGFFITH